jgi:hypothetical protein
MAISFGGSREEDVVSLIAKKNYTRAIQILRTQLEAPRTDPRVRLQLADVLAAAGKAREAVPILLPLADEYAHDGFAAKAVSVLKRIQKIDPGRRDVEARLAQLIERKQREATVSEAPAPGFEIGIEEIGFDPLPAVTHSTHGAEAAAALPRVDLGDAPDRLAIEVPALETPLGPLHHDGEMEIGFEVGGAPMVKARIARGPAIEAHSDGVDIAREIGGDERLPSLESEEPLLEAEPLALLPDSVAPQPLGTLDLEDYDLLGLDEIDGAEAQELLTLEAVPAEPDPMSDDRFVDELMSLVDGAFGGPAGEASSSPAEKPAGHQIVVSPLFKDFSVDEMVAVIGGLRLLTFERGGVIVREGERGDSLYMLALGQVRAFRRDTGSGKQMKLADLEEGAFFGEVSILTRGPRTATVAALTRCELLELDRPTLDGIVDRHPRVQEILEQFARERLANRPTAEPS